MKQVAESLGLPIEILQYVVCLAAGFPLAFLFKRIPVEYQASRHLFSIVTSTLILLSVFSLRAWLDIVTSSTLIWVITKFFSDKAWMPVLCFFIMMAQMSFVHLEQQIWKTDLPDASSSIMVLVMKLTSFAWSVYDGTRDVIQLM